MLKIKYRFFDGPEAEGEGAEEDDEENEGEEA